MLARDFLSRPRFFHTVFNRSVENCHLRFMILMKRDCPVANQLLRHRSKRFDPEVSTLKSFVFLRDNISPCFDLPAGSR